MALLHQPLCGNPNEVVLKFRFQINGTSDPDNAVGACVQDVTRDSTGVFTVTLKAEYRFATMITARADVMNDVDKQAQPTSWTQSTGAFVVTTLDDGAGAHAAGDPADNTWVLCELTLCRISDQAPVVAI